MSNNILFNLDPDRSYDRIVLDYADREWGYYEAENIYINISSGQLISAGLFRRMNARRSDDIILGGRTRGSQQRRRGGKFSTAIRGVGGGPLEIRGVTFSDRFPFKEDAVAEVSYKVFGGVPPYSQSVTWYVNGEVTPGMGGVQPTKRLNLLNKTHGDKFTAKINVSDSQGSRISTLVGATGVIMQPFSWDSLTIQPGSVEPTDSVTIRFEGLTGSSRYLDFGGEPIELPTGNDETFYLYIGVEESVGQTRATGVPSADGTSSIFDLGYFGEFADNYNFPEFTGLSGAVELANNAETIIANVTNKAIVTGQEEVTLSHTIGDTDFSWTLSGVGQIGEFVDGSLWVTPATGEQLTLLSTTPSPSKVTVPYNGESIDIYYDGVAINEPVGNEFDSLTDLLAYTTDNDTRGLTTNFRTTDNRHSFVFGSDIQNTMDQYFDIDMFIERKNLLESGDGIPLNAHDSIVLNKSYFDITDNQVIERWTQGIPFTGADGPRARSAIKNAAVLSVLPSAPTEICFRPPIQWRDDDRENRPMPALSTLDTSLVGVAQSPLVHSSGQSVNWNNENASPDISERMIPPFLHTSAPGAYAASWSIDQIAKGMKINGYGGNVIPIYNSLLNEIYDSTSTYSEEERTAALYRVLQYGIDSFGILSRLARTTSGAGQQPAVHGPWQQFTHAAFGNGFGVDSVFETYINGYSGLTEIEKAVVKQNFFHEDNTIRILTTGDTNDVTHFALTEAGKRLGGTLDTNKFLAATTADTNVVSDGSGQTDINLQSSIGFGRLDFSSTPYRWEGSVSASPKGLNHWDLIGTNLYVNVSGTTDE